MRHGLKKNRGSRITEASQSEIRFDLLRAACMPGKLQAQLFSQFKRIFFPALPGEYETLSVNYWNFDEKES